MSLVATETLLLMVNVGEFDFSPANTGNRNRANNETEMSFYSTRSSKVGAIYIISVAKLLLYLTFPSLEQ